MGGSNSSTQHQTQSNQIDPMQFQQYQDNYAKAQTAAGSLTPYTGQITAGFNPTQVQSQGILGNIATDPRYQAANNNAIGTVQGLLGANPNTTVTPQSVSANPYTASTYDPAQLSGTDLTPYMNPFQKNVIDASVAQNGYARAQQGVADNAAATAAHAFGGSRQGVQAAETTGQYDRNDQQNLAALNSANFGQAQNAAQSDIAARNAAGAFNAGSKNTADQFNSGQNFNAQTFNSGQNFNAQQDSITNALAQAGFKVNAAGQLESLNQGALQTAAQQGGILASVGDAQQQQTQKELSDAYNAYTQGQQLTLTQQQLLNQALGIIPIQQTQTTDGTTTTKSNPGIGGILSGIGSLALGVGSMGTSTLGGSLLGNLFGASKTLNPTQLSTFMGST